MRNATWKKSSATHIGNTSPRFAVGCEYHIEVTYAAKPVAAFEAFVETYIGGQSRPKPTCERAADAPALAWQRIRPPRKLIIPA